MPTKKYLVETDKGNFQVEVEDPGQTISEPTTYAGGFLKSVGDTASKTAKGVGEGALSSLNPVNWVKGPLELGKDIIQNKGANTIQGLKAIASGDPEAGGQAIGGLLTGGLMGRVIPKVPKAMVSGGKAVEKAGELSTPVSLPLAVAEAMARGDWKGGAAIATAPYVAKGVGKMLQAGGRMMGGGQDAPAAAAPRLVKAATRPTLDETLQEALTEAGKPSVDSRISSLPPEQRITSAGKEGGATSSGRPGQTQAQYDELLSRTQNKKPAGMTTAEFEASKDRGLEAVKKSTEGVSHSPAAHTQSQWPPESDVKDWHSGAEPGSQDAKNAQLLHRSDGELDALYQMLVEGLKKQ